MPAMLHTNEKARRIAFNILGRTLKSTTKKKKADKIDVEDLKLNDIKFSDHKTK